MMKVEIKRVDNPIKRGQLWWTELEGKGSVQKGVKPALIVSNDLGNRHSPTCIVIPLTSKVKSNLPTHIYIDANDVNGLTSNSIAMAEQIRVIDKTSLVSMIGSLPVLYMDKVDEALNVNTSKVYSAI